MITSRLDVVETFATGNMILLFRAKKWLRVDTPPPLIESDKLLT
jgi:hypothetical protein